MQQSLHAAPQSERIMGRLDDTVCIKCSPRFCNESVCRSACCSVCFPNRIQTRSLPLAFKPPPSLFRFDRLRRQPATLRFCASLGARAEWYEFIEYARNVFLELNGIAVSGSGRLLTNRRHPDFLSEH